MRNGDTVNVRVSGNISMLYRVLRDGIECDVVEIVTANNERMVFPKNYVSVVNPQETVIEKAG